jgi:hypothetical protein
VWRIGVLMAHSESDPEFKAYLPHSGRVSRSSGGQKAATSKSPLVGGRSMTPNRGNNPQRSSSRCSPTLPIAPQVKRAAFLFNPATAPYVKYYLNPFNAAAASLGLKAIAAPVNDRSEIESVVAAQSRESNSGLVVIPDGFLNVHRARSHSQGREARRPSAPTR